ncbi:hypothetical protein OPV22_029122 [Ensete ventricosum]|uniref:Reverse transcriptase Ty1/copia-type domain-containing protein n=1 Tax=Ensete ventricosum TaxID=4639 RepID=A0AAV8Q4T9_ENSVE|nr:hypothetical protein OPV22_029122 [Ensete ventricosum]
MLREAESAIKKEKPILYIGETKKKGRPARPLRRARAKKDQVLAKPRRLARGEMDLKMGNGARVTAVGIGDVTLHLPVWTRVLNEVHTNLRYSRNSGNIRMRDNGILSQWTPPYTPHLNGVSKRRNRTLLDMVRSMMSFADLLILGIVKIWGCPAHVRRHNLDKLESRTEWCTFVGYPKETCGYYFYHLEDRKIFVIKRAMFLEKEHILGGNSGSEIELSEVREPSSSTILEPEYVQEPNTQIPTLYRSSRVSHPLERYVGHISGDDSQDVDPQTYEEAIMNIDSGKWQEVINFEMDYMYSNKVWSLVDPPEGIVPIGCKWIFKKKIEVDGKVETYKVRLVAKEYRQRHGVDYDETFSPIAMLKSIRIILVIAAHYDYEIWQMDVKTVFLNGNLEKEMYMIQPERFVSKESLNRVCRLLRSIYRLKQSS